MVGRRCTVCPPLLWVCEMSAEAVHRGTALQLEANPRALLATSFNRSKSSIGHPLDTCDCDVPDCDVVVNMGWRPRIWEFGRDDCAVVQVATNLDGAVFGNDAQSLLAYYLIKGEGEGNFFSLKGDDGGRLDILSEFAPGGEGGRAEVT